MIWRRVLLAMMLLYALSALVRVTVNTLNSTGGIDLYTYWYDGVLARLGINTFTRYVDKAHPESVLSFVGVGEQAIPTARTPLPANPAFGIILFTGLALFQWEWAKILWLILNLLGVVIIPFLLFKLVPNSPSARTTPNWEWKMLLALSFWVLLAVRNAIGNGQLSVFTFLWMLVTLWLSAQRKHKQAGITLALALIKFSVGTPLLVYLLIKRRWTSIGIALILHGVGMVVYSLMVNTPIFRLVEQQVNTLVLLRLDYDIRVVNLATLLPAGQEFAALAALIVVIPTGYILVQTGDALERARHTPLPILDLCLFVILTLTFTLMVYHNYYDSLIIGAFLTLGIALIIDPSLAALTPPQVKLLGGFGVVCVILMSVPGAALVNVLPRGWVQTWLELVTTSGTVLLTLAWGLSLWLLRRLEIALTHKGIAHT